MLFLAESNRMHESWHFSVGTNSMWGWECSDCVNRSNRASGFMFETRTDCIVDAMRSGYLAKPTSRVPAKAFATDK